MAFQSATCTHPSLYLDTDDYALRYGYTRPTEQKRISAEKLQSGGGSRGGGSSSKSKSQSKSSITSTAVSRSTFPGPLLLPGDDLSTDPKYPAQSVRQWAQDKDRNPVTPERNVVYVAAPPTIDDSVKVMAGWIPPSVPMNPKSAPTDHLKPPATPDIIDYLSAYYHGITVKPLPQALQFTSWTPKPSPAPKHVGLALSNGECVRIRTRASHDGQFHRQLNLNDLLDGAIEALPADAYALLMIVNHDIYEDEDDDFACGRAYGGSRVAVVSSARYHPKLDRRAGVDVYHAWPASHCAAYVDQMRAEADDDDEPPKKKAKTQKKSNKPSRSTSNSTSTNTLASTDPSPSPLTRALHAHASLTPSKINRGPYEGLWLGRVCKTAAHELGHCFGLDHCVYYACAMQGTASLAEDARQPPYLCPVDLAKLLGATKMMNATGADAVERYNAIQAFCEKRKGEEVHLFAAFHAWITARLEELSMADATAAQNVVAT